MQQYGGAANSSWTPRQLQLIQLNLTIAKNDGCFHTLATRTFPISNTSSRAENEYRPLKDILRFC